MTRGRSTYPYVEGGRHSADGAYVLVDDGPIDHWRYVFVPREA